MPTPFGLKLETAISMKNNNTLNAICAVACAFAIILVGCGKSNKTSGDVGDKHNESIKTGQPKLPHSSDEGIPVSDKEQNQEILKAAQTKSADEIIAIINIYKNSNVIEQSTFVENFAREVSNRFTPEDILRFVQAWPEGLSKAELSQNLMRELAPKQGMTAAISLSRALPSMTNYEGNVRESIILRAGAYKALAEWGSQGNLSETIEWIEGIPGDLKQEKSYAILGIYESLLNEVASGNSTNLELALEMVHSEELADRLYAIGYKYIANNDIKKARSWISGIETDVPLMADGLVLEDATSNESIEYINKLFSLGYSDRSIAAVDRFAGMLGQKSPEEAMEWLSTLPPEIPREKAIATVAATWRATNLNAARNWIRDFHDKSITIEASKWLK